MAYGDHDAKVRAAARLEELSAELPDIIKALRADDAESYGHVYHYRRRVSEVVGFLGSGCPPDPKRFDDDYKPNAKFRG